MIDNSNSASQSPARVAAPLAKPAPTGGSLGCDKSSSSTRPRNPREHGGEVWVVAQVRPSRRPKSESRKKSEDRNPKFPPFAVLFGFRISGFGLREDRVFTRAASHNSRP